jgi:sigma-54 dependent transcriptional regulator, acetoin dehydrogenase operon transcriptional activator AcoR
MAAPTARRLAGPATADLIAGDRLRFLTAQPLDPVHVRSAILASWQRSRDLKIAADRILQDYTPEVDLDTPLTRTAQPVLRRLRQQLDDQPMSIILTDPAGLVLSRQTGDRELDRCLDNVNLAPGFSYAEEQVGTNGIGTALEVGGPAYVFGHEHYAEDLDRLSCAGVPIRDPIAGRTVGAIDLTCWSRDAGPLLMTLAKNTAEQIRQALLAGAGAQQLELLQEYLRLCRRLPGIVFAVTNDTVILNDQARGILDPADQTALLAHARESLTSERRRSVDVDLPSGAVARMFSHPVGEGTRGPGTVVHVKLERSSEPQRVGHRSRPRMPLPGVVGADPHWLRACGEVETAFRAGEWLVVCGEPGVGKLALLQAVQLRSQPIRRLEVLDAAGPGSTAGWLQSVRDVLAGRRHSLVIRHADRLDRARLRELAAVLGGARRPGEDGAPWVALTLAHPGDDADTAALLRLFPRTVEVPPLRLHAGDVPSLVSFFLGQLGPSGALTCSPEAMGTLARGTWPGNAQQLLEVLREVVRHRRTGAIAPEDLPPSVRSGSRRHLNLIEAMQRDAVVQALTDAEGDKTRAARSLGMSRATIYRKIHDYGIVLAPR